jgi:hypothetical protein
MFEIILYIVLALAAIALVFVVIVAFQPSEFRITRSATIAALPADVFTQVNDLHRWEAWSPWAKIDPGMKQTYEGPPAGIGAIHSWSGNNKVGEGRMTITESRPNDLITIRLEFMRPFAATHTAEFTFKGEGPQTVVTWSMSGKNGFVFKAFGLFMNMDKMLGGEFEKGLKQLNVVVASAPKQ